MPRKQSADPLPRFLASLFWETDFEKLRAKEYPEYVIERVIEYGDDRAISWLLSVFTREEITAVVKSSRRISPNTATLWSLVLGIPKEEVACLSKPSLLPHSSF